MIMKTNFWALVKNRKLLDVRTTRMRSINVSISSIVAMYLIIS